MPGSSTRAAHAGSTARATCIWATFHVLTQPLIRSGQRERPVAVAAGETAGSYPFSDP